MMSPWLIQTYCCLNNLNKKECEKRSHLLAHLAPNVCQPLLSVKTLCLQTAVTKHLCDLSVLLPILAEHEFPLVVVVLVLASPPVLASLHPECH